MVKVYGKDGSGNQLEGLGQMGHRWTLSLVLLHKTSKAPLSREKREKGGAPRGHSEFLCPTKECVSELQFPEEHPMKPYKLCSIIFASTVLAWAAAGTLTVQ